VFATVLAALDQWTPVWVIVDGSTDGSADKLLAMARQESGLRVLVLRQNRGKGAAVLYGLHEARRLGFTHALTMDSDGQHPADRIAAFMKTSLAEPGAMVLGTPVFDVSAPALRVKGRRISNWWANLETLWAGIGDSLYGFRVYPIEPLIAVMRHQFWMRRFDFDVEAVVRLCWRGVRPLNLPAPVRYYRPDEGGVSHFNYWRDNVLLTWMHVRLFVGFAFRLPMLLIRRARRS
jgi:glycosyltransferase involved in cell wall biosynthesis